MVSTQEQFPQPGPQDTQANIIMPSVFNESDTLSEVVIGYADNVRDNFHPGFHLKRNNKKSDDSNEAGEVEDKAASVEELNGFAAALRDNGVIVHEPSPLPKEAGNYNQIYPRDIGFVVADRFVVASMRRRSRMNEWRGIEHIIDLIPEDKIDWTPEGIFVEGGDVVVDKGNVFVGLSQRTDLAGFTFLANIATDLGLNPIPVPLKGLAKGVDVLHLDCAFVPVGERSALVFEEGFEYMPKQIRDYDLIPVSVEEQEQLATNMFALSPTKVITRDNTDRVNEEMSKHGLELIEIPFNEATKFGGNLRCCTLPLVRIGTA